MTTPDGREGWSDLFLRMGHSVFLIDEPRRGGAGATSVSGDISTKTLDQRWYTQFRIGRWEDGQSVANEGSQFPNDAESVDQFFRQMTPGNPRFAYDSYRRFIMMFADVVIGVPKSKFERKLDEYKEQVGAEYDTDLSAEDLKKVVDMFKQIYFEDQGKEFPQDPKEQLFEAAKAVFRSWDNPRAFVYRRMNDIPYSWGTAVNVQMMVFGNMGDTSGIYCCIKPNGIFCIIHI